ncbi:uncharacterized protein LOC144443802 [Glandiceps talaboti]
MYEVGRGDNDVNVKKSVQDGQKGEEPVCGVPPAHPGAANQHSEGGMIENEDSGGRSVEVKGSIKLVRSESLPELTTKLHNEAMKIKKWKTSSENILRQKENELNEVRHTVADQDEFIEQLQLINKNLQAKIEEMQEAADESQCKKEHCESCSIVKIEFFKLEERLAECSRERDALKDTDRIRRENFEELLEKYRLITMENEELKIQVRQEQEECQKVIHEFHIRQESFNTLKEQMNIVSEQNHEKDMQILQLTRKLADSLNKQTVLDEEYGVLHNILKETEEVVKSQQDQLNFCHSALKRSHAEISKLNETKLQLLKQCEDYQDKDRDMQSTLKALNDNISELAGERQALWDKITLLNDNVKEKKKRIAEVKKDLKHHKKLIKKVSGVANQQTNTEDWSIPVHIDVDDINDDLYGNGPIASSPRRDERLSLWQQDDLRDHEEVPEYAKSHPLVDFRYEDRQLLEDVDQNFRNHDEKKLVSHSGFHRDEVDHQYHVRNTVNPIHSGMDVESRTKSYRNDNMDLESRRNSYRSDGRQKTEVPYKQSLTKKKRQSFHEIIDKENVSPCESDEEQGNMGEQFYSNSGKYPRNIQKRRVRRLTFSDAKVDHEPNIDLYEEPTKADFNENEYAAPRRKSYHRPEMRRNSHDAFGSGARRNRKHSEAYQRQESLYNSNSNKENELPQVSSDGSGSNYISSSPPFTDESSQTSNHNKTGDETTTSDSEDKRERHMEEDDDDDDRSASQMSTQQGIDAEGVLLRKQEMESYIIRAKNRGWQSLYVVQRGNLLMFYEDQYFMYQGIPFDDSPLNLTHAQITVATDYTKKKHVFRARLPTGVQYLFQARDHCEMMYWLCSLDAASHDADVATAPYGANYPLHIMENITSAVPSNGKVTGWKKFLQNTMSPLKKK